MNIVISCIVGQANITRRLLQSSDASARAWDAANVALVRLLMDYFATDNPNDPAVEAARVALTVAPVKPATVRDMLALISRDRFRGMQPVAVYAATVMQG